MRVLIIGAGGMIGRRLTAALLAGGRLGEKALTALDLVDIVAPDVPAGAEMVQTEAADLSQPGVAERLVAQRPDLIFHLAAIVSGQAEEDFELGYAVNLDGTRLLLEAIRKAHDVDGYRPRLVFTSSIAVFGAPFPQRIGDDFALAPLTSYGAQKAICELLLGDYSRRGFVDGIGIRLPTVAIRPGKPNRAASGFFSGIVREPLKGEEAVLPVADTVRHWFASPGTAVGFLLHAATIDTSALGARRSLTMPGVSVTVAEEIEALRAVAGEGAVNLIRRERDERIEAIVAGWPQDFSADRALALGFAADESFEAIVRAHVSETKGG